MKNRDDGRLSCADRQLHHRRLWVRLHITVTEAHVRFTQDATARDWRMCNGCRRVEVMTCCWSSSWCVSWTQFMSGVFVFGDAERSLSCLFSGRQYEGITRASVCESSSAAAGCAASWAWTAGAAVLVHTDLNLTHTRVKGVTSQHYTTLHAQTTKQITLHIHALIRWNSMYMIKTGVQFSSILAHWKKWYNFFFKGSGCKQFILNT